MPQIKWLRDPKQKGKFLFTFDGVRVYNLFKDYPHELTAEQKAVFDEENPYWAEFFHNKQKEESV